MNYYFFLHKATCELLDRRCWHVNQLKYPNSWETLINQAKNWLVTVGLCGWSRLLPCWISVVRTSPWRSSWCRGLAGRRQWGRPPKPPPPRGRWTSGSPAATQRPAWRRRLRRERADISQSSEFARRGWHRCWLQWWRGCWKLQSRWSSLIRVRRSESRYR